MSDATTTDVENKWSKPRVGIRPAPADVGENAPVAREFAPSSPRDRSVPARPVLTVECLSFTGAILVWAARQWQRARANPLGLRPSFVQLFGIGAAPDAMRTFHAMMTTVFNDGRRGLQINAYAAPRLSRDERTLVALIAAIQDNDARRAAGIGEWLVPPLRRAQLMRASTRFAGLLTTAGRQVTDMAPAPPPALRHGYATRSELSVAETVLLSAVRDWVACLRVDFPAYAAAKQRLDRYGVRDGALSLNAILRNLLIAATTTIDIRCPNCPALSIDEARLLYAVAASQHGDTAPAYEVLSCWLPLAAVRLTVDAVAGLGNSLLAADLQLPKRAGYFDDAATHRQKHLTLVHSRERSSSPLDDLARQSLRPLPTGPA